MFEEPTDERMADAVPRLADDLSLYRGLSVATRYSGTSLIWTSSRAQTFSKHNSMHTDAHKKQSPFSSNRAFRAASKGSAVSGACVSCACAREDSGLVAGATDTWVRYPHLGSKPAPHPLGAGLCNACAAGK